MFNIRYYFPHDPTVSPHPPLSHVPSGVEGAVEWVAISNSPFKTRCSIFDFLPSLPTLAITPVRHSDRAQRVEESISTIPSTTFDNISEQFPGKYLTNRLNPDTLNLTDAALN